VSTSPLVKTAFFGNDANWGRILAAAGRSGARFDPEKVDVFFGPIAVCRRGAAVGFSEKAAKKLLQSKTVVLTVDLNQGRAAARYLTCDFSLDYVKINADYRT
jgi:glutamate N-acetyltransferase/amino-acid N-acetyltransferase